jgi:GNAT superfamily N-acetyltransferase
VNVVVVDSADQADIVRDLIIRYLADVSERLGELVSPEPREEELSEYGAPRGAFVLLSESPGEPPCAGVGLRPLENGRGEIKRLWVQALRRGRGYGRLLMSRVVEEARRRGYRSVLLDSHYALDEARRLYLSLGFRDVERYNDNPHAQYWMALSLENSRVDR